MQIGQNKLDNVESLKRVVRGHEFIVDIFESGESWSCWIDGKSCLRKPVHTDMLRKAGIKIENDKVV